MKENQMLDLQEKIFWRVHVVDQIHVTIESNTTGGALGTALLKRTRVEFVWTIIQTVRREIKKTKSCDPTEVGTRDRSIGTKGGEM
jgi:hypothetical protein